MIRAFVLYDSEPDAGEYAKHVELAERVPGATFRHGKIFGAPMGEPKYAYYAEFEFPDRDTFKVAAGSDEFMETAKDATKFGIPFQVLFANVE